MTMKFYLTPVIMAVKKTKNAGEDVGEKYPLYTVGGNVNWCSCYGNQYGDSQKKPKNKIAL
jgi:hypothetical protein